MDPLELLNERINDFPGYATDTDRRRSDEMVRAFLGEMLADLQIKLAPLDDAVTSQIGDLLFRSGFTNQIAFRPYESVELSDAGVAEIATADVRAVDLADVAATVRKDGVPSFLADVTAAFDARDAAMRSLAAAAAATGS
jgi:hypothetical protein